MSVRRSSRVKSRVDYNELSLSGGRRRASYSVFANGITCESETTEVTGSMTSRIAMPLALRERNLNVEESAIKTEKEELEEEEFDEEEELDEENEDPGRFGAMFGKLRKDLAKGFRRGFKRGRAQIVAPSVSYENVDTGHSDSEERNMSVASIVVLLLLNAVALSVAAVVLTDSTDKVASSFIPVIEKVFYPSSSVNATSLSKRGEFMRQLEEIKSLRKRVFEEKARPAVRKAISDLQRSESEDFEIDEIVKDVAELLAGDRALGPDFLQISAGATVLSSVPSLVDQLRDYVDERISYLLGRKDGFLRAFPTSPSIAFQKSLQPGDCWAFPGDQGKVSVRLAVPALVKSVAMEHAPANTVQFLTSAPRDFRVVSYNADGTETTLGEFTYDAYAGKPHQLFDLDEPTEASVIRLEITSNHDGKYTCLYRFRIHGTALSSID